MKRPIEWHKQCLANSRVYLQSEEFRLKTLITRVESLQQQILLYEQQIQLAESNRKDGFDAAKYGLTKLIGA